MQKPLFDEMASVPVRLRPERAKKAANGFVSSVWSFPEQGAPSIYRWYGTLPLGLVERLLSLYAPIGSERILDPFLGSGMTLEAASKAGNGGLGLDCNPLSCLLAEAKIFSSHRLDELHKECTTILSNESKKPLRFGRMLEYASKPRFDYTRKWFREDTLEATLRLLAAIAAVKNESLQRQLFVVAAQVVREVASVDPRCTHHLVTKQKPFLSPYERLRQKVALIERDGSTGVTANIRIEQGSILTASISQHFDFGIIHPPYLGVIHYHQIHRLATDLLAIAAEVGMAATLRRYDWTYDVTKAADFSTDDSAKYSASVAALANRSATLFEKGARCAVIIGDQRHKGFLRHPFTDFITHFEASGFTLEENFIWLLQNNGGMHVLRRGHFIDHNYILIFQRR
ncbi:MAG: hypothetical protein WA190_15245 [Usitatibacter sp.]